MKYLRLFENWKQNDVTETPEFKKWFEGSKIVDRDGKPLLMYYGTYNKKETIENNFIWQYNSKERFCKWFSPKFDIASGYGNGDVISVYLNIKNPYVFNGYQPYKNEKGENLYLDGKDNITTHKPEFGNEMDETDISGYEIDITYTNIIRDELIKRGFDGVLQDEPYYSDEIVVFSPDQIWVVD